LTYGRDIGRIFKPCALKGAVEEQIFVHARVLVSLEAVFNADEIRVSFALSSQKAGSGPPVPLAAFALWHFGFPQVFASDLVARPLRQRGMVPPHSGQRRLAAGSIPVSAMALVFSRRSRHVRSHPVEQQRRPLLSNVEPHPAQGITNPSLPARIDVAGWLGCELCGGLPASNQSRHRALQRRVPRCVMLQPQEKQAMISASRSSVTGRP
jgi:hypothetical protein